MASKRTAIPEAVQRQVLMEAGYRCAVPTCRNILAIDLHHIVQVSASGGNDLANLLALCPTCHALYHRGTITQDAIYSWKGMLVALNQAFDKEAMDNLLFLYPLRSYPATGQDDPRELLLVSGDGVLKFSHLIAAGLASFKMAIGSPILYTVALTPKGRILTKAWMEGNRTAVQRALAGEVASE